MPDEPTRLGSYDLTIHAGAEPLPGYRLLNRLGKGGFGEVWKVQAPGGFEVALKFVQLLDDAGNFEVKSLDVIKRVRHPHLLTPFGAWRLGNWLVIGMELAECSLWDKLSTAHAQGLLGILWPELAEYMMDAAKGVDHLNASHGSQDNTEALSIQHRDIKPQNLLLIGGGVKVADFGLARLLEHSFTGHTGAMTPAYAAPEFFDRHTANQSDQYSLAVTYCQLRGGRLPFVGSFAEIMAGHLTREPDLSMLPETERSVVSRSLAKTPKARWPNCRTFIEELHNCNKQTSVTISKPPATNVSSSFKSLSEFRAEYTIWFSFSQLHTIKILRRMGILSTTLHVYVDGFEVEVPWTNYFWTNDAYNHWAFSLEGNRCVVSVSDAKGTYNGHEYSMYKIELLLAGDRYLIPTEGSATRISTVDLSTLSDDDFDDD